MIDLVRKALRTKQIQAFKDGLSRGDGWQTRLGASLARRRLLVVFGMGLLLTVIEMIDHLEPGGPNLVRPQFWHRIPIYALALPLLTWVLLEWVERSEKSRNQADHQIEHLTALRMALMNATSWDDLLETIIQYPRLVMPPNGTALYVFNEDGARFELAGHWSAMETNSNAFKPILNDCPGCLSAQSQVNHTLRPCSASKNEKENGQSARFCAPLIYKGTLTALLLLDLPADYKMPAYEEETLNRALPEMGLAIANARLERSLADQADSAWEVATTERQRIAQDLHDTLAQNIGYLRLKLDQLSYDGTLHDIVEIQHDIDHMRDTATEAYEQIRGTLTALDPASQMGLAQALRERAIHVGQRAGFKAVVDCEPDRFPLDPEIRRQLLFICQEALNNIEKHAGARVVTIQVDWCQKDLSLSIVDDGNGFDVGQDAIDGHIGLAVMRQRAESIGGKLTIDSQIGSGTRVTVRVPVAIYQGRQPNTRQMSERADSSK